MLRLTHIIRHLTLKPDERRTRALTNMIRALFLSSNDPRPLKKSDEILEKPYIILMVDVNWRFKMASKAMTSAGTTISIAATLPATYDASAFAALAFTEIGEVSDLGEFGREYNIVKFNPLKDRRTVKRKGSFDDGTVQVQLAKAATDEGQIVLREAVNSDSSYAVKIVLQDGTTFYLSAQVSSSTVNVGNVDQITSSTFKLEIDNDIIEVLPA